MERELLSLSMFLIAAGTGAARFRFQKTWDDLSLGVSLAANAAGTALLALTLLWDHQPAALVPLSLLLLMHGTALLYKNHFVQIFGLPLVIGEMLLGLTFTRIWELYANPSFLLAAWIFHMGIIVLSLRLLLHLPQRPAPQGPTWNPYALARKLAKDVLAPGETLKPQH